MGLCKTILDICPVCGKTFPRRSIHKGVRQKTCSKQCRYKSMPTVEKSCKTCGKNYTLKTLGAGRKNKDYCSLACIERSPCQLCGTIITGRHKFQCGERRFCSKQCSSIVNSTAKGKQNYVVRGFAACLNRINKIACEHCGFSIPEGLAVHHINGDHDDVSSDNLKVLCANCHSIEHWGSSQKRKNDVLIATRLAKLIYT